MEKNKRTRSSENKGSNNTTITSLSNRIEEDDHWIIDLKEGT